MFKLSSQHANFAFTSAFLLCRFSDAQILKKKLNNKKKRQKKKLRKTLLNRQPLQDNASIESQDISVEYVIKLIYFKRFCGIFVVAIYIVDYFNIS